MAVDYLEYARQSGQDQAARLAAMGNPFDGALSGFQQGYGVGKAFHDDQQARLAAQVAGRQQMAQSFMRQGLNDQAAQALGGVTDLQNQMYGTNLTAPNLYTSTPDPNWKAPAPTGNPFPQSQPVGNVDAAQKIFDDNANVPAQPDTGTYNITPGSPAWQQTQQQNGAQPAQLESLTGGAPTANPFLDPQQAPQTAPMIDQPNIAAMRALSGWAPPAMKPIHAASTDNIWIPDGKGGMVQLQKAEAKPMSPEWELAMTALAGQRNAAANLNDTKATAPVIINRIGYDRDTMAPLTPPPAAPVGRGGGSGGGRGGSGGGGGGKPPATKGFSDGTTRQFNPGTGQWDVITTKGGAAANPQQALAKRQAYQDQVTANEIKLNGNHGRVTPQVQANVAHKMQAYDRSNKPAGAGGPSKADILIQKLKAL